MDGSLFTKEIMSLRKEILSIKEARLRGASVMKTKSWTFPVNFVFNNDSISTKYVVFELSPEESGKVFLWNITQDETADGFLFDGKFVDIAAGSDKITWKSPAYTLGGTNITTSKTINFIITATDEVNISMTYEDR